MAWDPLGEDEYSGDAPMDAFGLALKDIAERWQNDAKRLPAVPELATSFGQALRDAGYEASAIDDALRNFFRSAAKKKRPPPRKTGQVLRVPYGGSGDKAIYGRILHAPAKGAREPGLGICVIILDRDIAPGDDLGSVVDSPWLLGPTHPNDALIREGVWEVIGEVPLKEFEHLPNFARSVWEVEKRAWRSIVVDYFGKEIDATAESRSRVMEASVGGAEYLVRTIRAIRGLERYRPPMDERRTPSAWRRG